MRNSFIGFSTIYIGVCSVQNSITWRLQRWILQYQMLDLFSHDEVPYDNFQPVY